MIKKTTYEEFYRYHNFTPWLNSEETITSATVKIYKDGVEVEDMVDDIDAYDQKKVIYKLKGGVAGQHKIVIQIVTSNHQKFEDSLNLLVI